MRTDETIGTDVNGAFDDYPLFDDRRGVNHCLLYNFFGTKLPGKVLKQIFRAINVV
jgi:hypothetical protein